MSLDPKDILAFINSAGILGGAILVLWLLYTERLVPASRLEDQKQATKSAVESSRDLTEAIKELTATVTEVRIAIASLLAMSQQQMPPTPPRIRRRRSTKIGGDPNV